MLELYEGIIRAVGFSRKNDGIGNTVNGDSSPMNADFIIAERSSLRGNHSGR
jgi:hypothetical protein